jgi:excisionase family DNA binding protein
MAIRDLSTHPLAYVSVGELASYWRISRKQIYKQIDAGTLPAIRLGPRLFRIRTCVAREFEENARMSPGQAQQPSTSRVG